MDRVEANSHRLMALGVQTAQRQSTNEYHLDQLTLKLDRLSDKVDRLSDTAEKVVVAVTANGENTRALARIAESHQRRIESLEGPRP
jgi:outer membrane murein-binding lipoprotein Lpp